MIKTSITFHRPNTNVPWHNSPGLGISPPEYIAHVTNYMQANKLLYIQTIESENKLSLTFVGYWMNRESLDEFNQDPFVIENFNKRDNFYKLFNGKIDPLIIVDVDSIDNADL
jgi:hypothetical protein